MEIKVNKIGVLMGGISAEREVSLRSGQAVSRALRELKLPCVEIDVDGSVCEQLKKEDIDLAFLALHGGWGENGAIQGLLEIMGIRYTGSGVLASALAMDKEASKKIFLQEGIKVAPFFVLDKKEKEISDRLPSGFKYPVFVKPAAEGSSVGVSMVKSGDQFARAVREAFSYGERVIVENYIKGKEIQIGVLGDRALGGVEVRPGDEFYSYKAKYTAGATEYILPPVLGLKTYRQAQKVALRAHSALGCCGATRVDLIVDESNEIYVLEVNTIPGMTETSLLPKIAGLAGFDFRELIKQMVIDALKIKKGKTEKQR